MTAGFEMESVKILPIRDQTTGISPAIANILKMIFTPSTTDNGEELTLKSLISLPFFNNVLLYSDWEPHELQVDKKTKKLLEDCMSDVLNNNNNNDNIESEQKSSPQSNGKSTTTKRK